MSANTVLGHYPQYVDVADLLGAARFSVDVATWESWSDSRRWDENRRFLDEAMRRGRLVTTTRPSRARSRSAYLAEVVYLRRRGYRLAGRQRLYLV